MINRLRPEEIIRKNEREIELFLASDDTDTELISLVYERLNWLESDTEEYKKEFSTLGFARKLIEDCIEKLS